MGELTKNVLIAAGDSFAEEVEDIVITAAQMDRAKLLIRTRGKLVEGIAHFAFVKKDGSLREAYGTLKPSLIPPVDADQEADVKKKAANESLQNYYDLEAGAYRSFSINRLVALF